MKTLLVGFIVNIAAAAAACPGDMILALGAGNVSQLGPQVLEALSQARAASTRER